MKKARRPFPKRLLLLPAAAAVAVVIIALVPSAAMATSYSHSGQVAIVPNTTYIGPGFTGELPTSGGGFSSFTFSDLPIANVNAANLAAYDTVVLCQDCSLATDFTQPQKMT